MLLRYGRRNSMCWLFIILINKEKHGKIYNSCSWRHLRYKNK